MLNNQVLVIARDITERKKMGAELREAELKFRILAEKSMVGIYIVQNGKFVYVNPRFAEVFGYVPSELVNTIDVTGYLYYEDYRRISDEYVRRCMTGESASVHYEAKGKKKDGTSNWVEFYGSTTSIGAMPTIIGSMIDITERRRTEELILTEKILSETIINSLPGIFYLRNEQGKLVRWNNNLEQTTGYTSQEIENLRVRDMIDREDHQVMDAASEKVFEEGYATAEVRDSDKSWRQDPLTITVTQSCMKISCAC